MSANFSRCFLWWSSCRCGRIQRWILEQKRKPSTRPGGMFCQDPIVSMPGVAAERIRPQRQRPHYITQPLEHTFGYIWGWPHKDRVIDLHRVTHVTARRTERSFSRCSAGVRCMIFTGTAWLEQMEVCDWKLKSHHLKFCTTFGLKSLPSLLHAIILEGEIAAKKWGSSTRSLRCSHVLRGISHFARGFGHHAVSQAEREEANLLVLLVQAPR